MASHAANLRSHRLDAALLGPMDYAREGSAYCIAGGTALSSQSSNGSIVIQIRQGIQNLRTLAVDPSSSSEIVLATIVLREEFGINPAIVPVMGPLESMLQKCDAALLVGDQALRESRGRPAAIDLVESWMALTGLPYVHHIWCFPEGGLEEPDIAALTESGERAESLIDPAATSAVSRRELPHQTPAELSAYLEQFSFTATPETEEGLKEYLKYVYYHGILPDVPDLRYPPSPGVGIQPSEN